MIIEDYNRRQITRGSLAAILSLLATVLSYLFFWAASQLIIGYFDADLPAYAFHLVAAGCIGLVYLSGWRYASTGKRQKTFADSNFFVTLDHDSGGAWFAQYYARRYMVPFYVLSQLCLAGPLQGFKAWRLLKSPIRYDANREGRIRTLLAKIESAEGWKKVSEFELELDDLRILIVMDRIGFSPTKGLVRAKQPDVFVNPSKDSSLSDFHDIPLGRLLTFFVCLLVYFCLGGFSIEVALSRGGFQTMLLFLFGAVITSFYDDEIGHVDPLSMRPYYIILGVFLMASACVWMLVAKAPKMI
ncbi:MAG: hypothetical protein AAF514_18735 [Verrucomicrobiota bacterium]